MPKVFMVLILFIRLNKHAVSTHPDIAALVAPLSASRIEGIFIFFFTLPSFRRGRREGGPAKHRPGESAMRHAISYPFKSPPWGESKEDFKALSFGEGWVRFLIFKHFTISHYFLRSLVKSGFVAGMYGGIGHNIGYRMAIAGFNRRMGLLTAADTFHPVAYMV